MRLYKVVFTVRHKLHLSFEVYYLKFAVMAESAVAAITKARGLSDFTGVEVLDQTAEAVQDDFLAI